jgi:2-polyprenyl-6-hydroxyphenyl methylase / 3-demethylubiquinone-9 3-methyltransferase
MNLSQYTINYLYSDLKDDCYCSSDYPVSFLRAEHNLCDPWILEKLSSAGKILDIGCGAGMLANALAKAGHQVTGLDLSNVSLDIARNHDATHSVQYLEGNAYSLPFQNGEFDTVCIMDVLDQVEEPHLIIGEAARVLKTSGILFFHTFNRTLLSYLLVIKGIKHSYRNQHNSSFLIRPDELEDMFDLHKLKIEQWIGIRPCLMKSIWKICATHQVPLNFTFCFSKKLSLGYGGYASKRYSFPFH